MRHNRKPAAQAVNSTTPATTQPAAQPAPLMHAAINPAAPAADQVNDQDAEQPAPTDPSAVLTVAGTEPQPAPQLAGSEDATLAPNQRIAKDGEVVTRVGGASSPAPAAAPVAPVAMPAPVFVPLPRPARSLDELLEVAAQAQSLTTRVTRLRATSEKLSGFTIGRDGYTDTLTIRDGNGQEWHTTQSSVIGAVLELLRGNLRTSLSTAEVELRELLPAA